MIVAVVWGAQLLVYAVLAGLGLWAWRRACGVRSAPELPPAVLVVAVHGGAHDKLGCLESLLAQQYPGRLDVVFSFQDPRDPALAGARGLDGAGRAKIVVHPTPPGWTGAAANYARGIEASKAEVIVLACDDTLAEPDAVAALVTRLRQGASVVSALPLVVEPASTAARVSAAFYNASALFGWAPGVTLGSAAAWGGLMALRRSDLDAAGGPAVLRGRVTEDLALARAVAGGRRGAAALGPVIRSPLGSETWSEVWHRFLRLAVMAVHQSPHGRALTLLALALQYAYLGVPLVALAAGRGEVLLLGALLALTRWAFVGLASMPAGLGWSGFLAAPVADVLYVAALVRAAAGGGFTWSGVRYRVLDGGLERG